MEDTSTTVQLWWRAPSWCLYKSPPSVEGGMKYRDLAYSCVFTVLWEVPPVKSVSRCIQSRIYQVALH